MKKLNAAFLFLAAAFLLPACSSLREGGIRIGDTPAARVAKNTGVPGKGVPGQCLPFAHALQQRFEAAGIPSQIIVYGYKTCAVPHAETGQSIGSTPRECGAHAVVAYRDGGRTYVMDNQSWTPQWIHGGAAIQMAGQFSGINCDVKIAHVVSDSNLRLMAPALQAPMSTTRLAVD